MHNSEFVLGNGTHLLIWDFEVLTDNLISAELPDLVIYSQQQQQKNLLNSAFCRSGRKTEKLKENEKKDKYLELAREQKKKQGNMKVTVIPMVNSVLGTVTKGLVQGLEEWGMSGRVGESKILYY